MFLNDVLWLTSITIAALSYNNSIHVDVNIVYKKGQVLNSVLLNRTNYRLITCKNLSD